MPLVAVNKYSVLFFCTSGQALVGRKPLSKRSTVTNRANPDEQRAKTERREKNILNRSAKQRRGEKKIDQLLIPGLAPLH